MQAITNELLIRVGDEKDPIRISGEAVRAVQIEAARQAAEAFEELSAFSAAHIHALDEIDLERLLELRGWLENATQAASVLIDCRPMDEWGFEETEGE